MRILVTRPEPDASRMTAELEALGHRVSVEPLLRIEPVPIADCAFEDAQAVIATSRNGLRALGASAALNSALTLPIFAVGPGTAELARELGFQRVIAGAGAARDLVPLIASKAEPGKGVLVHIAGETVAFDLPLALAQRGFEVRSITAYRAVAATSLGPETLRQIADGALDAVLLMSPRTAETFAQLVVDAGLEQGARGLVFLCLSQAVAEALSPLAPVRTEVADAPNSPAILAATARVATRCRGV